MGGGKAWLNYRANGGRGQLDTEKGGDERGKGKWGGGEGMVELQGEWGRGQLDAEIGMEFDS